MIRARHALVSGAAVAVLLAACGGNEEDPCAGATTCLRLDVDSYLIDTIDQLQLDLVYGEHHATTTTGTAGEAMGFPLETAIILDLPASPTIPIDLVAAGKLGGVVLGADAASTTIQQGHQATLRIDLRPISPCTETKLYCGGTGDLLAQIDTLYRCTGGVPIFYARCSFHCLKYTSDNAECVGRELCRDGGTYCGGHALDGDPHMLYVCMRFEGTAPRPCPNGCLVRGDGDDACQ